MQPIYLNGAVGGAGDQWCFLHACRHFARAHPELKVFVHTLFPNIVRMWPDSLITLGYSTEHLKINPYVRHRAQYFTPDVNGLGTFCADLGLPPHLPFDPPPVEKLLPGPYAVLQLQSVWAKNPPVDYVQSIVNLAAETTGLKIIAVGAADSSRDVAGIDYAYLADDIPRLISLIAGATLVLTPRSLAAQVAAAYHRPALVWLPNDLENWHCDYPGWDHRTCPYVHGLPYARKQFDLVLRSIAPQLAK